MTNNRDEFENELNNYKKLFAKHGADFDYSIDDFDENGNEIADTLTVNKVKEEGTRRGSLKEWVSGLEAEDAWLIVPGLAGYRAIKAANIAGLGIGTGIKTWIKRQGAKPMEEVHKKIGQRWLRKNKDKKGLISEDKYRLYSDVQTKTLKSTRGIPTKTGKAVQMDAATIGHQIINEGRKKLTSPEMLEAAGYIIAGKDGGKKQWIYWGAPIAVTAYAKLNKEDDNMDLRIQD
tara:strand:+ start:5718 stop:6416 length:699 start_codon:yes stop_codon:yes gene_type:complete